MQEMYAKRKEMIEPIFGQSPECRFRAVLAVADRPRYEASGELVATVHNLLKLWRNDRKVEMAG